MAKLVLSDLASLANQTSALLTLNNNWASITDAFENTLSRDGTAPNAMEANLDMNSNRILNLPDPIADTEPVRKAYYDAGIADIVTGLSELTTAVSNAETSALAAATSEENASISEANAENSEDNAALSVTYAEEWAIAAEDTPVSEDAGGDGSTTFSALHWAAKAEAFTGSIGTLPDLTDVTITSVGDGELLQYDNGSSQWINQTIAEIGLLDQTAADALYQPIGSYTLVADLASTSNGEGASLVGIEDVGDLLTATTVEGALAEIQGSLDTAEAAIVAIENDYITSTNLATTDTPGLVEEATAAEILSGAADKFVSTDLLEDAMEPVALSDGANIAVNLAAGVYFTVTLGGNRQLDNPTNHKVGRTIAVRVTQGAGGQTLSYDTQYDFGQDSAPVLSTGAGVVDILFFYVLSSTKMVYLGIRKGV